MVISVKALTTAFCEASGTKSILRIKPQSLKGINPARLKFVPQF